MGLPVLATGIEDIAGVLVRGGVGAATVSALAGATGVAGLGEELTGRTPASRRQFFNSLDNRFWYSAGFK